ncbi:MAG TPA: hypothetical protein VNO21_02400 [Polyangiaceae bacterium]|nr:hypothetical protein [Polyangiaceae bacterium]
MLKTVWPAAGAVPLIALVIYACSTGSSSSVPSGTETQRVSPAAVPAAAVLTQHNDNGRTGANTAETHIDVAKLAALGGMVRTKHIALTNPGRSDGQAGAVDVQSLYYPQLTMSDGIVHDVVYVFTNYNDVFAIDANSGTRIWHINPHPWNPPPGSGTTPLDSIDGNGTCGNDPNGKVIRNCDAHPGDLTFGIHGAPVIDPSTNKMYVVFSTGARGGYFLGKIDITSGNMSAIPITATVPNSSGGTTTFGVVNQFNRAALLLNGHGLYVPFGAAYRGEIVYPYHGWVMRYNPTTLAQTGVFCTTPDAFPSGGPVPRGSEGSGIWHGGGGLGSDSADNVYFSTGTGLTDPVRGDYGTAMLRLSPNVDSHGVLIPTAALLASDITNPTGVNKVNTSDLDLGSGGVLLPPGTNSVIGGGKTGVFYIVDRTAMNWNSPLQDVQAFINKDGDAGVPAYNYHLDPQPNIWGTPVYWRGPNSGYGLLYAWSDHDNLKAFHLDLATNTIRGVGGSPPSIDCGPNVACGNVQASMDFTMLGLTANGNTSGTGVLWTVRSNRQILQAYNAESLGAPLWSKPMRDAAGGLIFGKWTAPTVADGKLFIGVANGLDIAANTYLDIYQLFGQVNAAMSADGVTHVRWVANMHAGNTTWVIQSKSGKTSGNLVVDSSQPNSFAGGVQTGSLADPVQVCAVVGNETECSDWVTPRDATKATWFDITSEDGQNTGWWTWNGTSFNNGIPTVPWAQASRLAHSFCVSLGFASGQPNGWQSPNTVGAVCYGDGAVQQLTNAARDTSSSLTTSHFQDTNLVPWATAFRAASDICWNENNGQHLRGFFDGEQDSAGMELECFSASGGAIGFDVTPQDVNYTTSSLPLPNPGGIIDTGNNNPNVVGWDLAARIAHDYCQAKGHVGGRFNGYLSSTVLGIVCY